MSDIQVVVPEIGEWVEYLPTGEGFQVERRTKFADGRIVLNGEYPLDDCCRFADMPYSSEDLATLVTMVAEMIASGEYELDLLATSTPAQKQQLWDVLTPEQRAALKAAGRREVAA